MREEATGSETGRAGGAARGDGDVSPASPRASGGGPAKWRNPHRRLPAARWVVQGLWLALVVLTAFEFHAFWRQAMSGGAIVVARPPAVEGFLPISALLGLERLLTTGGWDDVHPAGLTILVAAIVGSLVARKSFCSWICPVGTVSRGLEAIGRRLLWRRRRDPVVPRGLDLALSGLKYPPLAFFLFMVFVQMDGEAVAAFLHAPYNFAADAKMLLFFADLSSTAAIVLVALVVLSVAVKNFWCRYLCPYGALLGLASWLSPQRVLRDEKTCIDCDLCTRACPVEIRVAKRASVTSPECTGCMGCVAACPVKDCLTVGRRGAKGWSPWLVPALGVGALVALWAAARLTGHWHMALPAEMLARIYRMADLGHP